MNKHKKFIKEAYEGKHGKMCPKWERIILEHYPEFKEEQFKEGDWLINRLKDGLVKFKRYENELTFTSSELYGTELDKRYCWDILAFRIATKEEIESHLRAEAKRRGFKEGVYVENSNLSDDFNPNNILKESEIYTGELHSDGYLWVGRILIYDNGKWAEIIPTMTKEEAEEKLNCKIL